MKGRQKVLARTKRVVGEGAVRARGVQNFDEGAAARWSLRTCRDRSLQGSLCGDSPGRRRQTAGLTEVVTMKRVNM